jgi:hypothetical protein
MANEKENTSEASSSGAGSSQQGGAQQNNHNNQTVQVFGSDLYSTAFILILLLLGFLKVSASPCEDHGPPFGWDVHPHS